MLSTFSADLMVWSAFLLPVMPIWLGIQQKITLSCFYVGNVCLGLLVGVFWWIQGVVEQTDDKK